jgi:translocation and assembly module TamB
MATDASPPPTPDSPPSEAPAPRVGTPAATPRRPRAGRIVAAAFGVVLLVLLAVVATAWWTLRAPGGTAWLLTHVQGVRVQGARGALLGDFAADRVDIDVAAGELVIEGLAWRGTALRRGPPGAFLHLGFDELRATRIGWRGKPPPTPPPQPQPPPERIELPIALDVGALRVGELRFGEADLDVVRELEADALHLDVGTAASHRVERIAVRWGLMTLHGQARIGTRAPLVVDARVDAAQEASGGLPAWQAQATASGPLADLQVQANVRATAVPGHPAQALDARGTVHPFAVWPLGALNVTVTDFDLSALHPSLPATRLGGRAEATTAARDQPATLVVTLANAAAGRWDANRLPVRKVDATLRARPDDLATMDLTALEAELGDERRAAGRVTGTGRWAADGWSLDARLDAIETSTLDGRAPAWIVGGPVALRSASGGTGALDVQGTLDGRLAARGPLRSVRLAVDAGIAADRIEVRRAEARVDTATASLQGRATRATSGGWQAQGQLAVAGFDPAPWLAGSASAPRAGTSRVDAQGRFDLAVPATLPTGGWAAQLGAVRGRADVTLAPSVMAGVPVRGEVTWRQEGGPTAEAHAALEADGNRLRVDGRLDLAHASGSGDTWDLVLDAPTLARLAPIWRLWGPTGAASQEPAGRAKLEAHVDGRWPGVATRGQLEAAGVRLGPVALDRGHARWTLGTAAHAPMTLDADLQGASLDGRVLESLRASVSGTAEAHAIDVRAVARALPPAWVDAMEPAAAVPARGDAARSVAVLRAQGGLLGTGPTGATGWRGTLQQVELRREVDSVPPWLRTTNLAVEAQWAGGPMRATLQPGRLDVLGAQLRWSRFAWVEGTPAAPMRLDVDAALDPLPVAPLLRQAQPAFGWGGDLTVGGTIVVRSAPTVQADIVFERRGGDLSVTDETGTQVLGLTDLRLGLAAANGTWSFTQAVAGRTLGAASGAIVARTPPAQTWPDASTPLEGVVELRVAELGTWGPWVPPGWRLGGALHASASLSGRLGAPEYTGRIEGSGISVRNFLEGVAVGEGEVAIALRGTTAHIERFRARAGNGTLEMTGDASLGDAPQARLNLVADRFQLLGRVDRRIVSSGNARVEFNAEHIAVTGRFDVDEGLVDFSRGGAPTLGDDVHVVRRKPGPGPAPGTPEAALVQRTAAAGGPQTSSEAPGVRTGSAPPSPVAAPTPAARSLAMDLQVDMGSQLHIRGHGLDATLRGQLHLTSPGGRLEVRGTVYTVDGTYAAYGQKLVIDRGQLVFAGSIDNPRLDIEATRPNLDVRVGVAVAGTVLNPRVRLFSEPDMAEIDKISWLVLGRASSGLGTADTALLQRAAMALLAGEEGGGDSFSQRFGLDDVSVRQETTGDVKETIVTLGKQVSRRWYVGYERGLNATSGSWQVIYRAARRFSVRAQAGGDNAIDFIWTWRWQ